MNKIWILIILIISSMGCSCALDMQNGVEMRSGESTAERLFEQGIGEPWIGGNPPSYSQFYSMHRGFSPKKHIEIPMKYEIEDKTPTSVYFGYQMQSVPYTQYQTYDTYTGGNSLWILGSTSWTQYAQVPQGSTLYLLATTATGGKGYLYEKNPDGTLSKNNFCFFPGSNQIIFCADTIGQHMFLFVIDGQVSNMVVIDVMGYCLPSITSYPTKMPSIPPAKFDGMFK